MQIVGLLQAQNFGQYQKIRTLYCLTFKRPQISLNNLEVGLSDLEARASFEKVIYQKIHCAALMS